MASDCRAEQDWKFVTDVPWRGGHTCNPDEPCEALARMCKLSNER